MISKKLQVILGLGLGAVAMYLATRNIPLATVSTVTSAVDYRWLGLLVPLYFLELGVRALRWHALLDPVAAIRRWNVYRSVIVGYAFNILLPARMGELVRVDYCASRFAVPRAVALSSIVVERLLDGLSVVAMATAGLVALSASGQISPVLLAIVRTGAVIFGAVGLVAFVYGSSGRHLHRFLPGVLEPIVTKLGSVVTSISLRSSGVLLLFNVIVWILDTALLWSAVRATGTSLDPMQAIFLTGIASLSTLAPTAPGFIGSYQYVFVLCLELFGFPRSAGVVAASLIQIFVFGSLVAVGLFIYFADNLRTLARLRAATNA